VPNYQIRPATAQDVGFLTDVVFQASQAQGRVPDGFDEKQWRAAFAEGTREQLRGAVPGCTTSVIEVDGEPAGRLRIISTADGIELPGIQLLPGFQCRGIGTAIIEDLKARAAALGIPVGLDVEKDNPGARRLYDRLGFIQVGETEQEDKLRWGPPARSASSS
jgi:ribosomal protein S18 acetylase RimI-like enzyme